MKLPEVVNDVFGHQEGDNWIKTAALLLKEPAGRRTSSPGGAGTNLPSSSRARTGRGERDPEQDPGGLRRAAGR
jgi:hypothetical protein